MTSTDSTAPNAEAWAALRSPEGWRGYTVSRPVPVSDPEAGDGWHAVLAIIQDNWDVAHWDVYAHSEEHLREQAVAAVREWSAES